MTLLLGALNLEYGEVAPALSSLCEKSLGILYPKVLRNTKTKTPVTDT
jgi:hypothetical protein